MPAVILTVSQNTFVSSAQPNDNFSYHPLLYAGTDEIFENCISLLKFDFTTIAVNSVDSAYLQLAVISKSESGADTIVVNRVSKSFDASHVTYDTIPTIEATSSQVDITSEDLYKSIQIDVTQLVNDWLGGIYVNNGLALTNSADSTLIQFGSDKIIWEPYFPKLILNYTDKTPEVTKAYGYVYNTGNQSITPESSVPFSNNGIMQGVSHTAGSDSVSLVEAGTYAVWFSVNGQRPSQFALFLNNNLVPGSIYSVGLPSSSSNSGMAVISAQAGDILTVRNHNSLEPILLNYRLSGIEINVTASLLILKVGPAEEPSPPLIAANQAETETEMRIAVTNPALGLNLAEFDTISGAQQAQVLLELIAQRPEAGYANASDIQTVLNYAVEYSVDITNIYAHSESIDGVGNRRHPLGTIEAALAAVESGGMIHLKGAFSVSTINISKAGVTLLGEENPYISPETDSVPVIISAPAVRLNGLSIVSAVRRPSELVRVMSTDVAIVNCNLSGPGKTDSPQLLAGITTVGEEADNYTIENNRINSLDTGLYLLESSKGLVTANNISDTRCGISIDGGMAQISENSWLGLPNDADMVITPGTPWGPPYDDLEELSSANNDAVIFDEREQQA